MAASDVLIPSKFIFLFTHLLVSIVILNARQGNIFAAVGSNVTVDSDEYTNADDGLLAAGVITIILVVIEMIILFNGITLFYDRLNLFSSVFHGLGTILYAWYNLEQWHWYVIWYLWAIFSLIPGIFEIGTALFATVYYKKLNR
eukprot:CAMPEP_0114591440 /NCGR_PEP_ID=MMETSP0125-20121206/13481_1 /TAXON_ID=485358 ORGANISM="Aristerostoma sp., Strain ATCC 50986" /NCGR_SAMPLE_ID=MMETSP0125 /ASSEMBLY_ACC=CAM_ASM_000245 /LENGTH=143 /DNA_ID=CAMNT_0001789515 /DNA_START=39 /DNA_END=470 /DNA_ORIENTATION=-